MVYRRKQSISLLKIPPSCLIPPESTQFALPKSSKLSGRMSFSWRLSIWNVQNQVRVQKQLRKLGSAQRCAGKGLTTGSPMCGVGGAGAPVVAFANFYGVNTPITANFKLRT